MSSAGFPFNAFFLSCACLHFHMSLISASVSLFGMLRLRTCTSCHVAAETAGQAAAHLALDAQVLGRFCNIAQPLKELLPRLLLRSSCSCSCSSAALPPYLSALVFWQNIFQQRGQELDLRHTLQREGGGGCNASTPPPAGMWTRCWASVGNSASEYGACQQQRSSFASTSLIS